MGYGAIIGAAISLIGSMMSSDDDSSSSGMSSKDQLKANKYSLMGNLAAAKAAAQETSSAKSTDADMGSLAEAPSLGSSDSSSVTYPFSNQFANSNSNLNSNTNLANALGSLLGQKPQYYT